MTNLNKTNTIKNIIISIIIALCIAVIGQVPFLYKPVLAEQFASEPVSITNSDFNSSETTALQSTPNGWTKQGSSTGKAGVINLKATSFSSYALLNSENPDKAYNDFDNQMLMINAKSSSPTNESNHMGYQSNSIALNAYSFYKLSIFTLTQENAVASIYINGLGDNTENTSFERYTSTTWTEYRFYIATGIDSKTISIDLWLGSKNQDSINAVFFDHITMNKISGSYFYDEATSLQDKLDSGLLSPQEISSTENLLKYRNIIDLRDFESKITNANFETGDKTGWNIVDYLSVDAGSTVVSINNNASMEGLNQEYLGSDLSGNNNFSLALYSVNSKKTSVGVESSAFLIKPFETYKITVWAKVSSNLNGNAYIKLCEQDDVKNFYTDDSDFYTPITETITISSNTTNKLTNDYTPYYFYVKGHELFDTSLTLQLWLGDNENTASGCVVFDDINFEKISWSQFDNAESTNSATVTLSTITNDPTVANGAFNKADSLDKEFSYPVKPANWTTEQENNKTSVCGIINTYSPIYETNKTNFGNAKNPKNPSSAGNVETDVNNILMMYNQSTTYQSIVSPEISLSKQSYQKLSFDYKTVEQSTNTNLMNVYILDEDNNVLYSDEGLYSSDWTKYEILFKSTEYTNKLKLKISLGNENNKVSGFLYLDNVNFSSDETMTDEMFASYSEVNNTLEFDITNFGFVSNESVLNIYKPYRYTQNLEKGTNPNVGNPIAYGGMIDGKNNVFGISNSENNKSSQKFIPAIKVNGVATYTLTSKETLTFESGSYYKISFDVLTKLIGNLTQDGKSDNEKYSFGATFTLDGIEKNLTKIISNDEWTTYVIYVSVDESTSVNLKFGLQNESPNVLGEAFFDAFKFEEIQKEEYDQGVVFAKSDDKILAITTEDMKQDDDTDDDTSDSENNITIWYIIPSLMLFVALIIAIVAYYMKKVTIKKWERKKVSEYDRNATLHRDVIRKEAEEIRDQKVKDLEKQIKETEAELARIEQLHKENAKSLRTTTGEVSRSIERDFKSYAKRHTALENEIASYKDKIDSYNMPEYLLQIQRSLTLEKIKNERQAKEAEIKKQKSEKKLAKQNAKKES